MKKNLAIMIIMLVIGAGAFYGGMKYEKSRRQGAPAFGNLSAENRQKLSANAGARFGAGNQPGGNSAGGEIIARDDQSITIKLRDSGSKIIFYSDTTEVGKFATGGKEDLKIGKTVIINGKANQDGSITAESIQIRPDNNQGN